MSPSVQVHIHPSAIAHNLTHLRQLLMTSGKTQQPARIWAVVKADAYGHGLNGVLSGLHGADGLAVCSLASAYACREAGWNRPLLYMGYCAQLKALLDPALAPLHIVVSDMDQIVQLEAHKGTEHVRVWLRFAGALNHSGFKVDEYREAFARLQTLVAQGRLAGLGHLQHYARADDVRCLEEERTTFTQSIRGLAGPLCTENSAGILNAPDKAASTAWVRSGILLYGINPLERTLDLPLQAAMSLRAPIVAIQHLAAGDSLGYGGDFRARRAMRIGLIHCGYAHGYPRHVSSGTPCRVADKPSTLVGKVSMETLSVDLTAYPEVGLGTLVTLWGDHGLSIETIARCANTIPAHLCTALTKRAAWLYPDDPLHVALQK